MLEYRTKYLSGLNIYRKKQKMGLHFMKDDRFCKNSKKKEG